MPSFNTVDRFVTLVESGQFLEAIDQFYADDASMQENGSTPRVGKDALLKFESAAQASVASVKATCIRPMLISEDIVVIRWVFESVSKKSGRAVRFEELAYQRWEGELIAQEQFFYDPGQLK